MAFKFTPHDFKTHDYTARQEAHGYGSAADGHHMLEHQGTQIHYGEARHENGGENKLPVEVHHDGDGDRQEAGQLGRGILLYVHGHARWGKKDLKV